MTTMNQILVYSSNYHFLRARIRVPFIWTKFGYQKRGSMRVVPLNKDSKNAFGLNLALKPRSHKVRKGLLVDLFSKIERLGKIHQNGHF